jgi:DNA repair and recombination protein RAD54B
MYAVVYRKKQNKKHKTWDGDGFLEVKLNSWILLDENKKEISSCKPLSVALEDGLNFSIGSRDVEIVENIKDLSCTVSKKNQNSENDFQENKVPENNDFKVIYRKVGSKNWEGDGFLKYNDGSWIFSNEKETTLAKIKFQNDLKIGDSLTASTKEIKLVGLISEKNLVKEQTFSEKPFQKLIFKRKRDQSNTDPVFKKDGILMNRIDRKDCIDVAIDRFLAEKLREHQVEGVKFMYDCVMGLKSVGQGAILADDMGLGKSLQAITLIWILSKQSPHPEKTSEIKKTLLICPASLLNNWKNEFKKWLGDIRIKVFMVESKTSDIKEFFLGKIFSVMVIGYEKLVKFEKEIIQGNIDLCICDEGHRIKNGNINAAKILSLLPTKRRIILSGTPLQNNLTEYYHMVDFVNPGILGDLQNFKTEFENPISASLTNSNADIQDKINTLTLLTKPFILRRDSSVNQSFLLSKTEFIIYCKMNSKQIEYYLNYLSSFNSNTEPKTALSDIINLRKIANSPHLFDTKISRDYASLIENSSKLKFVVDMLNSLKNTGEKVVVCSHWTLVLDILQIICNQLEFNFSRLDGATNTCSRQTIVDYFNTSKDSFIFLLSSKAGGVGLNLIGSSRFIMFDIDWNPSIDQQAMARVWREGQTRPVFIYRLISTGTIENCILKRQYLKTDLAGSMIDNKDISQLNKEELKELFTFDPDSNNQGDNFEDIERVDAVLAKNISGFNVSIIKSI